MKCRCDWAKSKLEVEYHDNEWGVPLHDDRKIFELLILEGMQAGLSWTTVLKKREDMRILFSDFDPYRISKYDSDYINQLMKDERIIRNRLKLNSMVINAQKFIEVVEEFGSFNKYIWSFVNHKPIINRYETMEEVPSKNSISDFMSKELRKRGFKFVGSTICYAFMQAIGMVNDHLVCCYRYNELIEE